MTLFVGCKCKPNIRHFKKVSTNHRLNSINPINFVLVSRGPIKDLYPKYSLVNYYWSRLLYNNSVTIGIVIEVANILTLLSVVLESVTLELYSRVRDVYHTTNQCRRITLTVNASVVNGCVRYCAVVYTTSTRGLVDYTNNTTYASVTLNRRIGYCTAADATSVVVTCDNTTSPV